ncbi:vWA domain-containing protein [Romeriopsis navalis]|uniref:vWA domain-containing protein n=1 Tax=Romeriopsis navalis TaxID=2992132 RepID=UPI0021F88011|nr:von Willebrand factor type A domain-containing protein [Romeriopsis navalis]
MNRHKLRQLGALGLLCCTLPIVPTGSSTHATEVARSLPKPPLSNICRGSQQIQTSHPDVRALKYLASKYDVNLPLALPLDAESITQYEFAQALQFVMRRSRRLSQADRATLKRLSQRYNLQQFTARAQRRYSNRVFSSAKPSVSGAAPGSRPAALAPPAVMAPAPMEKALVNQVPAKKPSSGQSAPSAAADRSGITSSRRNPERPQSLVSGRLMPRRERRKDAEYWRRQGQPGNTEGYSAITENPFLQPSSDPLSTFSIDVDTAAYSNMRRFLSRGAMPPKDAIRVEELINYFPYNYSQPRGDQPFSVNTAVVKTPWNPQHKLVRIGLQGKQLEKTPPSNLVFLLDVSGSMNSPNKLPLLKQSMCLLVNQLSAKDNVSIVVYAGSSGVVLPPTPGDQKAKIMSAFERLEAGGSTAGGAGIELAYKQAQKAFIKGGNNRVILATDGDFNVGPSSNAALVRMIEQKRDQGVFLTVLGFGTGNYKDSKMEQLANKGNGNYAYIDTLAEAKKVLVKDLRGTLFTIAKDVKIQVEFNPSKVQAYRLIGYENRALRAQDFNDDKKDAGEIGAGHRVTALYEVVPTGVKGDFKRPSIDPLKYQTVAPATKPANSSDELMQVKLRYKAPDGNTSKLISQPIMDQVNKGDRDLQFSSAVALFGMVLRDSEYKGDAGIADVLQLAQAGRGDDPDGYRSEFIRLVQRYEQIRDRQDN